MQLPFTEDQFLDVFARYNESFGYGALSLWLVTALLVGIRVWDWRCSDRWIVSVLVVHWLWNAVAYHGAFFTAINPAATFFAALFIVEAALLTWFGLVRGRLHFAPVPAFWGQSGMVLVLYSLAYPLIALASGFQYPRMPTFGVPCPTTLLTVGLLLTGSPPAPRTVAIVPLLWAIIGGSAAVLLGVRPDWALLAAAALLAAHMMIHRTGHRHQAEPGD